ncbi:capsule biosynthesis protein [Frigidibacter sp. MR17.14]|uniref:capsule biosynthesis protein n=1 Tax=Frigidibacter sp. MR17.14 TaxID=3126509 RepID=UPI003013017E
MTIPPKALKYRIRRAAPGSAALMSPAMAPQRPDVARPDPLRVDPPQPEAARPNATRPEAARTETLRARAPGAEPSRPAPAHQPSPLDQLFAAPPSEDGFGLGPFPTAKPDLVLAPSERTTEEELNAIRAEGLTGRQLRIARRVAQRHGIDATSDFEAVRLLRRRGIDPFQRSNMLDLVVTGAEAEAKVQLPQTVPKERPQLPAVETMTPERRAGEILRIQRDIARRRRKKMVLLLTRLAFFVLLPTLIVGWYYFRVATPLYATRSEFVIQQADTKMGAGNLSSLFSGTQFATSQDSITVQGYLNSREAMQRLDHDLGFRGHWSQPSIDPVQRLDPKATVEESYRLYQRNVKIGYDPTEGIIKMEVIAADPGVATAFAQALIGYAEEQVDQLTYRLREDQMRGARESYEDAERKVDDAQRRVLDLQEQLGVLDPVSENSAAMAQITALQTQLDRKRLELAQLESNDAPNAARVSGAQGDVQRLEGMIGELRGNLTKSMNGGASLAAVSGQLRIAEADLQTRQLMLSQAAQQMEVARIEANKQVRYLSTGVKPLAPDEATYPRAGENTFVALLIFSGLYLMVSLTASILKEQVSA